MGGGGGGGGGYDDKWIRDWTRNAEGREAGYVGRIDNLTSWNTDRLNENRTQSGQIGDLFGRTDEANRRLNEISGIQNTFEQRIGKNFSDIEGLRSNLSNLETLVNTPTTTGDVQGLDDIISNLQQNYSDVAGDVSGLDTRMTQNLDALGSTLRGEFASDIEALNLGQVREDIAAAEGNLSDLTENFAGLSSDMDWIKQLDLESFDDRLRDQGTNLQNLITGQGADLRAEFSGDLTDLRSVLESGRGEALANLESQLGKDRAADLLQLRQDVEEGRASEIEALAGNLRQEYGDKLFDLSDTFDERLSGVQSELGGDISTLFSQQGDLRGDLEGGLATLTSGLGTTSQQLEALRDSFGDYQTEAASNLGDVRSALQSEIGDLSGSLTSGLADLQTDYLDRILGSERAGASARDTLRSDLSGAIDTGLATEAAARQSGLATEAAARQSGLAEAAGARETLASNLRGEAQSALSDVYKTREQAIADLSGRFGENLRAQEASLNKRMDAQQSAIDDKIGRLGSMMNYRMLGDSAGGVKMRRSKAYTSGAINTGTGQLSRSMKLKTLNI